MYTAEYFAGVRGTHSLVDGSMTMINIIDSQTLTLSLSLSVIIDSQSVLS